MVKRGLLCRMGMTEGVQIYEAGYAARLADVSLNANPYLHTVWVETWERGWADAHYKQLSDRTRKGKEDGDKARG